MSAPRSRRIRRQAAPATRTRREVVQAVAGSAAVVLTTVFLVWAMRPGTFTPGTGGMLHRQPRVGWLIALALAAVAIVLWLVYRPISRVKQRRAVAGVGIGTVAVGVLLAIALWPGDGVLHHYTPPPTFAPVTTAVTRPTTSAAPTSSTAATSTTSKPATTTTATATTTTTAPASTTSSGG